MRRQSAALAIAMGACLLLPSLMDHQAAFADDDRAPKAHNGEQAQATEQAARLLLAQARRALADGDAERALAIFMGVEANESFPDDLRWQAAEGAERARHLMATQEPPKPPRPVVPAASADAQWRLGATYGLAGMGTTMLGTALILTSGDGCSEGPCQSGGPGGPLILFGAVAGIGLALGAGIGVYIARDGGWTTKRAGSVARFALVGAAVGGGLGLLGGMAANGTYLEGPLLVGLPFAGTWGGLALASWLTSDEVGSSPSRPTTWLLPTQLGGRPGMMLSGHF